MSPGIIDIIFAIVKIPSTKRETGSYPGDMSPRIVARDSGRSSRDTAEDHIIRHGFDLGYKTWVHHGELDLPPPSPLIDNTRQPQMSDMTVLLNDLSYIPPNNKHNETSNKPTRATRNEFEELYASVNEELYPSCDYVTRLEFMAKFTYFKVKDKLADSIFNEMLEFFQKVFPISKGYKLPPSYYAIKKTFKTIGLRYESIHACEHNCCLFRGDDNKDLDFCPVCNTSKWKDSNTPGKKVPKKVLRYFLIIPRLQCLYKSIHTAKEMIWHATRKCTEPDKMQHPVDGRAWKNFDTNQAYSMWPVILITYNLPPWLCMKESSFMLTLLIPGPKSSGKDIDVYLWPLIEDLKVLWDQKGVETIDVASGQKLNMRAMVLWTINDFLARSSLSGVVDILCDFKLIYHPALFDIMIHLVIHLPLEALEGGPIRPRWMFPFERYMKKLKGYVRNKAKPKGSIAEGYVAEEALTFSVPTDKDNNPEVSITSELFALACGPTWTPISINSYVVNGVSLNDLDNATLHIDGQLTEVDAPPDIIDVVDEDDDIIDDENALPHDLAYSDDEDLINVDDDGVDKMSADVARSFGGDGDGKGKRKPNLGGRAVGRLHTRDKTRNLSLREITDKKASSRSALRCVTNKPLCLLVTMRLIGLATSGRSFETQFDLRPHMESPDWTVIDADIQQHLQKAYNTNKATFKAQHWVIDTQTGTYNVEKIRRARPEAIMEEEWDKQSSATQEYLSLIDTFFVAHTINGVFTRDEDRLICEEKRRLEATGTYTDDDINRLARRGKQQGHILGVSRVLPARVTAGPSRPAPESTLKSLHKKVDFMMSLFKSDSKFSDVFSHFKSAGASRSGGSDGCRDDEESADDQEDEDEDGDSDS
nr:hypothetical protein [Tanacetum cinerariifolium]